MKRAVMNACVACLLATSAPPAVGRSGEAGKPTGAAPASGPAGPDSKALTPEELFAKASPAVVKILVYGEGSELIGQGSAFFVSADGLLITNHHVIAEAASAKVLLSDGRKLAVSGMLAKMPNADLALLKVEAQGLRSLKIAPNAPEVGAKVYTIGSPKGLTNTISEGLVSGYRDLKDGTTLLQTSAPISPGSSGGPLLSATGEVVGVTSLTLLSGQNLNFAVPCKYLQALLLIAGKPMPLPGAKTRRSPTPTTAKVAPAGKCFRSALSIVSEIPGEFLDEIKTGKTMKEVTRHLYERWLHDNLLGCILDLEKVSWAQATIVTKYRPIPGRFVSGVPLHRITRPMQIHLCAVEKSKDGRTYYVKITLFLEDPLHADHIQAAKKMETRKLGDLLNVRGRIESVRLSKYPRLVQEYFGVHRRTRSIRLYTDGTFADRNGMVLSVTLADWRISEYKADGRPTSKPYAPSPAPTPEAKATGRLKLAEAYLANGLKQKAIDAFTWIITNFPNTQAAQKAREELRKLKAGG